MKKRFRVLSLILSACMVFNLAPLTASAAEMQPTVIVEENTPSEEISEEDSNLNNPDDTTEDNVVIGEENTDDGIVEEPEQKAEEQPQLPEESEDAADSTGEELTEGIVEEQELLTTTEESESPYFAVDANGVLIFKDGQSIQTLPKIITADMITKAGNVTTINKGVFNGSSIEEITIPSCISSFGEGAFENCNVLSKVAFDNNTTGATALPEKIFSGCSKLQWSANASYFKIPEGIETIGVNAFEGCSSLTGVTFSSSVSTLKDYAFTGCTNLVYLRNFGNTKVTSIGKYAFQSTAINDDVVFPITLSKVEAYAFANCEDLGNVDFSSLTLSEESLVQKCFAGSGLTGIKLPNDYTTISAGVFEDCNSLTEITIGTDNKNSQTDTYYGVAVISANAFKNCKNLKIVNIKNSVTKIEDDAFSGCTSITTVRLYQQDKESNMTTLALTADAFPANKGMVVYSYSGTGEEWAGSHNADGVSYKSLFTGMNVKINTQHNGNAVSVTPGYNVSVGNTITVKDTAATDYRLISLTHGSSKEFVESNKKLVVASSDISDGQIQIDAAFANVSKKDTTFSFEAKSGKEITLENRADSIYSVDFETANKTEQLMIFAKNRGGYGDVYSNPWLWQFSSSNAKYVAVDANGKLRLLKKTAPNSYVTITASLKSNPKTKITLRVTVGEETAFGDIAGVSFNNAYNVSFGEDSENGMQYIQTSKKWVEAAITNKTTRDVKVTLDARDANNDKIESSFTWNSGNTNIAKVAKATTDCNDNIVKICGVGETTITATSTVDKKKSYSFIVRVVDKTPYVYDSAITINAPATSIDSTGAISEGIEFTLIQAYGGNISNSHMSIVRKDKNTYTSLAECFAIEKVGDLNGNEQKMQIAVSNDESNQYYKKNASYTNLFVKLMVDGDYYYVQLPKITIVNKAPTPTVKLKGKINTFYTRDAEEQTQVTAKITSPKGYEFASNYQPRLKSLDNDEENNFYKNFNVEVAEGSNGFESLVISQAQETLEKNSKGKIINTGYLVFKYNGYDECKLKITVPIGRTAPNLSLEKTSVTAHVNASKQSYAIGLYNRTTKKFVDVSKENKFSLGYNARSSAYFDDNDLNPDYGTGDNKGKIIVSTAKEAPTSTVTAYIIVGNEDWTEDLVYGFKIGVTKSNPSYTIGNGGNIAINLATSGSNNIPFEIKSDFMKTDEVKFTGFTANYGRNIKMQEMADKINIEYTDGKLVASISDYSDGETAVAPGTYKYTSRYSVPFIGTGKAFEANISVSVKVYNTKPSIKLKNNTFTLNNNLIGVKNQDDKPVEIATTTYTVNNVSSGASNTINNASYKLQKKSGKIYEDVEDKPIAINLADGILSIYLQEELKASTTYKLTNVTVDGKKAEDIIFTVRPNNANPKVSIKAAGTINVLEPNSAVTYTVSISNFNGTIDASNLELIKQDTGAGNNAKWSDTISFRLDEASGNKVKMKAKEPTRGSIGKGLEKRKYSLKVDYVFGTGANGEYKTEAIQISTTPVQTMPKVDMSANKATLYLGTISQTEKVKVTPKKGSTATITGIQWSTKNNATMTKAFSSPVYDTQTNELTLKIKNAALLKKGTTYTLYYNIKCDGQLENTVGTEFSIKVTVK